MRRFRATFQSLRSYNFRLYFAGQTVSMTGTWMQRVAQAWLVLELTGSGTLLGITAALQFLPMLVAGPWGGLIADRSDKRRLLLWTQGVAGALALVLGVVTLTGVVELWMVFVLAFGLGSVNALDNPARHSFVFEMVGRAQVANAITLISVVVNGGRVVGPAVAGLLITTVGIGPTFAVNAGTYVAVLVALALMRRHELDPAPVAARARGQLREGFRYVRRTPQLIGPLLLVGVVGMLGSQFEVVIPVFARYTFQGDAQTYSWMLSSLGLGAVLGGLFVAGWLQPRSRSLVATGLAFGGLTIAAALATSLPFAVVALFGMGAASIALKSTALSLLQMQSAPAMRGRVMALWAVAFLGTRPLGSPLVGWIAETVNPRFALGLGGIAVVLAAGALAWYVRSDPGTAHEPARRPPSTTTQATALSEGVD